MADFFKRPTLGAPTGGGGAKPTGGVVKQNLPAPKPAPVAPPKPAPVAPPAPRPAPAALPPLPQPRPAPQPMVPPPAETPSASAPPGVAPPIAPPVPGLPVAPPPPNPAVAGLQQAVQRDPSEGFAAMGGVGELNPRLGMRSPVQALGALAKLTKVY